MCLVLQPGKQNQKSEFKTKSLARLTNTKHQRRKWLNLNCNQTCNSMDILKHLKLNK